MMSKARFIISKKKVIEQYKKVQDISDIVSYSYKTNYDVGKILEKETNCDFCVHSIESLNQLKYPKRCWFFAQAWNKKEIEILFKKGVSKFVVDNINDLNMLLENIQGNISLLLRMRLKEHTVHTGKHFVYGFYSEEINKLIPKLKQNKNIKELGIHFHRKTQNVSEWSLKEELEDSIKHFDKIDFVDIGGGLPAVYKNYRVGILQGIFSKIIELKKWLNSQNIKMIIEPGRFIAASPVILETNIVNIYKNNIVIDCSVFNAAMDTFVAHIRLKIKNEREKGEAFTIKGCTPDSMDIFRYRAYLDRPDIGDKLVFLNAGAYTYSSDFCNLQKLDVIIVN
ncbi:decarboxylase [archaeon]|jgi:ornithine decarboxylase|nr:decarboxylase [archaeon]MBT4022901.1 decarboxylase [archaeon]MBT4272548.1 decarboxylase [archaeon]MBT4460384.1 decarboxylase [archaeon]MBT4859015.1 decarboxylase [archaeon]